MVAEIKFGVIDVDKLVCVGHEKEHMSAATDETKKGDDAMKRVPPSLRLLFSEGIREHIVYGTDEEMEGDLKMILGMMQGMIPLKFMSVKLDGVIMVGKVPAIKRMIVYFDKTHETVSYNSLPEFDEDYGHLASAFKSANSGLSKIN